MEVGDKLARQRDYKAEYARRKERAVERGYTTSQARGHARTRKGELPVSIQNAMKKGTTSRTFRDLGHVDRKKVVSIIEKQTGMTEYEIWAQLLGSPT